MYALLENKEQRKERKCRYGKYNQNTQADINKTQLDVNHITSHSTHTKNHTHLEVKYIYIYDIDKIRISKSHG